MKNNRFRWRWAPLAMLIVGAVSAVLLLVLRAVRMPMLQDATLGRLTENTPATVTLLVLLLLLAAGAFLTPRGRVDVSSYGVMPVAITCILAGGLLGLSSLYEAALWVVSGVLPSPATTAVSVLPRLIACGMLVCGVIGGVALVLLGLRILSQGGTCAEMSTFIVLAPVLWAWFRLAWYELAYAATVGWSEKFYDFMMVIFQLLFLFKLARLVSGIGKAPVGELMALAVGSAVTALSGCVLRVVLFFTTDAVVYSAGALVGLADVGIGLLGLVTAIALYQNYRQISRL